MERILKRNIILSKINNYLYDSLLPMNINYLYNSGSLLGLLLISQIVSGFFLACYYIADMSIAFNSVEYIMREVPYGYIIRYTHAVGAALFFFMVYLHIARGLLYGSYTKERMGTWILGVGILLILIITAFVGYSLPYGQMSYWAIKVITNLLTVIPYVGTSLVEYIYGGYNIGTATLGRFYAIHYILPIILVGLVMLHLITLHNKGGTNQLGINSTRSITLINFHPYFTIKDILGFGGLLTVLFTIVFFAPNLFNHSDNYVPANPFITPTHIVPEIYLLYYYMGLRSIPSKVLGVIVLLSFIILLAFLPYLHKGIISTVKFRPIYKYFLFLFFINFILGTYLGSAEVEEPFITLSQLSTGYYLLFLIVITPLISFLESLLFTQSLPQSPISIKK